MSKKSADQSPPPELESQRDQTAESTAADAENPSDATVNEGRAEQTRPPLPPSNDERVAEAERQVLLAHAELENFRKRMQRESDQLLKYANLPLLRDLLDVVDNLNRALEAVRSDPSSNKALLDGVEMVSQQLAGVFAKFGCKPVQAVGAEFDPNVHEAIAQMPSEEHAAGLVAQEVAVGYVLHDRVVRPSSVIVSTGPAAS